MGIKHWMRAQQAFRADKLIHSASVTVNEITALVHTVQDIGDLYTAPNIGDAPRA